MQAITDNSMDKITTPLVVTNRLDQVLTTSGLIPCKQVNVTLQNVIVSTKTTTLCLPADAIAQLGLKQLKEVYASSADGISKVRVFQDATIFLMGREGTFDCLELPEGSDAILGFVPIQTLGIELDLQNQTLKLLPISSSDTYLTIL